MSQTENSASALRVADLPQNRPVAFDIRPNAKTLAAIAAELGISGLRKLSFVGTISAEDARDWRLDAQLGATVIQPCVVTLAPVTTRIDESIVRRYLASWQEPEGEEVEMTDDDSIEPLGPTIDPAQVMIEALALALPEYPRAADAELGETVFTEPGKTAMRDDDTRPFAGLAELRKKLGKDG